MKEDKESKKPEDKHTLKLELSEEEFQALRKHAAEDGNIPTKTYSEMLLRNLIRDAKKVPKSESILSRLTKLFS